MDWYIAKLVFRIVCEKEPEKGQFDEQLWLVSATSAGEALFKARRKGMTESDSFKGEYTGTMRWQFIDVAEVTELGALEDGTPIYSRVEETDDLKGYLISVQRKAQNIGEHQLLSTMKTYC